VTLRLRALAQTTPRYEPGEMAVGDFVIEYVDLLSLYYELKDIWSARLYHFDASTSTPRIIDGGGYIGASVLYFKSQYPGARITTFEPDKALAEVLRRNVERNNLADVEIVTAGLAASSGTASFAPDGADGGHIVAASETNGGGEFDIETVPLSDYLDEPVDFLKLNVEGMELPVLEEARAKLHNVREIVIEYHGWPGSEQRLGPLLQLLDETGFRYIVNHFDYETNPGVKPPFKLAADTRWFAIVYARRNDLL
jgi:FkbM family methyltransferase